MPDVTFTQEDIVSSVAMEAGWQPLALKDINEGPGGKDPSSTTWTCDFVVLDGPYKGAMIRTFFSSKRMRDVINYVSCFVAKPVAGQSYPLESTKDKPVMGYCQHDPSFNNNKVVSFKPVGK
jgi:hypothetical protein